MNEITDRLRDATRAVGETIDQVPAFSPAAGRTRSEGAGRVRRAWLVPLAAAASVTVAVAGGVAVARGGDGSPGRDAATSAGPAAAPTFFAETGESGITVRSVNGGAETSRVPNPSGKERFVGIQAAQDNRLFYAVSAEDDCRPRLYRFTLDEEGKVGSFGPLPFAPPEGTRPTSLAVSGDGGKLAYGLMSCGGGAEKGRLVVADTVTGDSRTWTAKDGVDVSELSMTADGRFVLFARYVRMELRSSAPVTDAATLTATEAPSPYPMVSQVGEPIEPVTAASPLVAEGASDPTVAASPVGEPVAPVTAAITASPVASEATATAVPSPATTAEPSASSSVEASVVVTEASPVQPSVAGKGIAPQVEWCHLPAATILDEPGVASSPAVTPDEDPVEVHAVVKVCPDLSDLRLLDTGAPGDSLEQASSISLGGGSRGMLGAAISPDGSRIVAAFQNMEIDGKTGLPVGGSADLIAYDTADGKATGVVYHEAGEAGIQLLDLDGTGERVIVSRGDEIGAVDAAGYRALVKTGEPSRIYGSRYAW
ncbi:hypothetical protein ACFY05_04080 [Microtetraspora fusca]|uniref:WD40 repeat domain-containing protein n=1 Tax=Microtetraspora fusca TaxID=1997 RepID=A0ABW6V267_MICFU